MIEKRAIIDIATKLNLGNHVVEKDYVLGWLLWGISNHEKLSDTWVFKGGTCLKKCFFETYRFSEDLDFTLRDPSHLDADFLRPVFQEIGEWIYEETGIEIPPDLQRFDVYQNPRGHISCQGRIAYRGPVSPKGNKNLPRIKLDLTADETIVLPPQRTPIFHPYEDEPQGGITVMSYAYEEAFGEKVRALAERARPRDLYDVVNLYRNDEARPSPAVLLNVLSQKCAFKGIEVPTSATILAHQGELDGGWADMLAHQLPALPPVETFWEELGPFFTWLEGGASPEIPAAIGRAVGDKIIRERTLRLPVSSAAQSALEVIRFAAANRLCVDMEYAGTTRRIEPYSLRQTKDENIILHAHSLDRDAHRSYRVDRIQGARVTGQTFVPRHAVELTSSGPVMIQPTTTESDSFGGSATRASHTTRRTRRSTSTATFGASTGPTYIYECGYCGKTFRRKQQTSSLKPHKDKNGYPCSGRYAQWIDTKY